MNTLKYQENRYFLDKTAENPNLENINFIFDELRRSNVERLLFRSVVSAQKRCGRLQSSSVCAEPSICAHHSLFSQFNQFQSVCLR